MVRIQYILFFVLLCLIPITQSCDVVGDSTPSESQNFVLDSLRIIQVPDTQIVIHHRGDTNVTITQPKNYQQDEPVNTNKKSKLTKGSLTLKNKSSYAHQPHRKSKRQGDAYPMDFIPVKDYTPPSTKHSIAAKPKKHKKTVSARKNNKKNARSNKKQSSKRHVEVQEIQEPQPKKYTFRYSSGYSNSKSQNNVQATVPTKYSTQKKANQRQSDFVSALVANSDVQKEKYSAKGASKTIVAKDNDYEDDSKLNKEISQASQQSNSSFSGKTVTICITGVDSRLGVSQRHADANHVLKIWLDKGVIDIYSVPRGTPVNAGFSSKTLNYLANLRSNKGRDAYLRKMEEITGCGHIDYWMELGFSQAMGVMEMLGFQDNAKTALRVIRSRKAFATGDYQRCYNQGQFIRQMILRHFGKSTGFMGGVALRSALNLVETNLKFDVAKDIIAQLEKSGFPKGDNSVSVKVRPKYTPQIQNIDLWDDASISLMNSRLENKLSKGGYIGHGKKPAFVEDSYEKKLVTLINRAEKSVQKSPKTSISLLRRIYEQRSWIQITDKRQRQIYFERICKTLIDAYERSGFVIEADNVKYFYEQNLQTVSAN